MSPLEIDKEALRSLARELFEHVKRLKKGKGPEEKPLKANVEVAFGKLFSESQHVSFQWRPDVLENAVRELISNLEKFNLATTVPGNREPVSKALTTCGELLKIIMRQA
jgi:hypothetical protein